MSQFDKLGLSPSLIKTLTQAGYDKPTPIQEKVIPLMLDGRDIVGIAQTGTGKTAAFVLPLLERLKANQHKVKSGHCAALIIVPTRELAAQIDENIAKYGAHVYHQRACIVGGVKYPKQINRLKQGLHILVATPGRLEDHIKSGNLSLAHTETIILDEADQMLDLGFFPAIRRIVKQAPRQRQTILLSATMPKQIRSLATDLLDNPTDVAVAPQAKPVDKINQQVMLVEKPQKRPHIVTLVENQFRTIIFTRTKHGADQLVKYLSKQNIAASAIHGNKSQSQRQRALQAFRKGDEHILIATDIAARGIDIPDISLVVNYDVPTTPEAYVHRIGRTARAGREGKAVTLCSPEEANLLRDIEKLIKRQLPAENMAHAADNEGGYNPMSPSAAKPKKKPTQDATTDNARVHRSGKKADPKKRRGPKDSRSPGNGAGSKRGSGSKKTRGGKAYADRSGRPRKAGGNKNPPRGPARRRAGS